jgi:periplasmic divalent cation tolerance protein
MDENNIVVLITAPSDEVGKEIARMLVRQKLAACVNLLSPIHSIYTWEGEIQEERETLLVVKTRAELFESKLIPAVRAAHPYDVPEIIALPIISGLPDYLNWIQQSTV